MSRSEREFHASAAVPASAPARVLDRLRGRPDGPLPIVHHGPHAVYLDLDGWCLGVLAAEAVLVPNGIRTRIGHIPPAGAMSPYLEGGVLHIDSRPLAVGRVEDVHVPRLDRVEVLRTTASSATARATPTAPAAELAATLAPDGIDAQAVAHLVGRGDGLTPLGDDLLAGWLVTRRALGVATPEVDRAVRDSLPRTTLLSATLLDCALHGEAIPQLRTWLAALGTPHLADRTAALLAVGHSSGGGLLAGALLALHQTDTEGALAA
jgi:hypothetical protein